MRAKLLLSPSINFLPHVIQKNSQESQNRLSRTSISWFRIIKFDFTRKVRLKRLIEAFETKFCVFLREFDNSAQRWKSIVDERGKVSSADCSLKGNNPPRKLQKKVRRDQINYETTAWFLSFSAVFPLLRFFFRKEDFFRGWMHIDVDFLLSSKIRKRNSIACTLHETFYFHAQSEREKRIWNRRKKENSKQVDGKLNGKSFIRTSQGIDVARCQFVIWMNMRQRKKQKMWFCESPV